jgi:hypothetical protein
VRRQEAGGGLAQPPRGVVRRARTDEQPRPYLWPMGLDLVKDSGQERGDHILVCREVLGDEGHRLFDVAILLELDIDQQPSRRLVEHIGQQRRLAHPHAVLDLAVVEPRHGPPAQARVMDDHELAIGGAPDVDLDSVTAQPGGLANRVERILRRLAPRAAMGDDEGARALAGWRHGRAVGVGHPAG